MINGSRALYAAVVRAGQNMSKTPLVQSIAILTLSFLLILCSGERFKTDH